MTKTVIVVGAGASNEFGLPVGSGLVNRVSTLSAVETRAPFGPQVSDQALNGALRILANGDQRRLGLLTSAAKEISTNMPLAPSIDNFLHTRQQDADLVQVGKIAIATVILRAERSSSLFVPEDNIYNRLNFGPLNNTWIAALFKIMISGRNFEQFLDLLRSITFISFNYDRCLYQYLINAAISWFNISEAQVPDLNNAMVVIYPYGSLGPLQLAGNRMFGFGAEPSPDQLIGIGKLIHTFTEGAESRAAAKLESALDDCANLIFLGFSFLQLNMELLGVMGNRAVNKVMATGKGLSEETRSIIEGELASLYRGGARSAVAFSDRTCFALFHDHQRFLEYNL